MNIDKFLEENCTKDYNKYDFYKTELILFLEKFKQEICKEQREMCAGQMFMFRKMQGNIYYAITKKEILSAPEPKLERTK